MTSKTPADRKTEIIDQPKPPPRAPTDPDIIPTQYVLQPGHKPVGNLVIQSGPATGGTRPIYDGTNAIGRNPDLKINRIALDIDDAYISRNQHAVLTVESARRAMTIHDNDKTNRIKVNGQHVTGPVSIKSTDVVQIGRTTVRFELT